MKKQIRWKKDKQEETKTLSLVNKEDVVQTDYLTLFEGVTIFFHQYNFGKFESPLKVVAGSLRLDYCYAGHVDYGIADKQNVFFEPGFLKLDWREKQNMRYFFPSHQYSGVTIIINTKAKEETLMQMTGEKFNLNTICDNYRKNRDHVFLKTDFIDRLFEDLRTPTLRRSITYLRLKVAELLIYLSSKTIAKNNCPKGIISVGILDKIRRLRQYLDQNFTKHLSLEMLSHKFEISTTSMKKGYRDFYGASIHAYLREKRIEKACELLKKTNFYVARIANEVGYTNPSKFAAMFKKKMMMTPTKYRSLHRY
ncbi:helix-turn-helix transcriptional regulator [Liquorilactobacillus mali]|uniref:AraC family transcriptional regulator n=1 Tax=Liquorilactobacillus mali KCTC 3596 = DSM 20444 TaxID=1046596 RepID=J0KZ29_9LACO|nr:AraC family transcriptional regulator [Liquorilactobacillus mali]EJE99700.1 AraC family transcriptional regulator [Liquorilactobacillus mali KCTC 3596 = DSM 20444]KRN08974.1 AraC family transcriptional regulator [Liquorilactobacillus mali KCTC 3596 = DSM 20444]QFQ73880.1 helix-turn-helix transcriptional regulator [Liquorilactobacillus mali]